jgi:hypothetical protein
METEYGELKKKKNNQKLIPSLWTFISKTHLHPMKCLTQEHLVLWVETPLLSLSKQGNLSVRHASWCDKAGGKVGAGRARET